jgi:peptide deformylase
VSGAAVSGAAGGSAASPATPDEAGTPSAGALAITVADLPPGRVLPVVTAPARVLATPSWDVDPTDPEVVALAADLVATMRVSPGCVGLAAPQVGVGWRVFAVDVTGHAKANTCHGEFVLVNPQVLAWENPVLGREGCMSVPDLTGDVPRATRIVVSGLAPGTGETVRVEADAFEARALQHELDHLDGKLFLDRVGGAHAVFARRRYLPARGRS